MREIWRRKRKEAVETNVVHSGLFDTKNNDKLRHYATVVRPEAVYGTECLILNTKMMEELAVVERRTLRKIVGPLKEGDQYRRKHNNELNKHIENEQ